MNSPRKTHTTAVVIIPPRDVWEPIQELRRRYDRQVDRWMPHITMLYPFRPPDQFDDVLPGLRRVCDDYEPFETCLRKVRYFQHGQTRWTLWLDPMPNAPIRELRQRLQLIVPECTDTAEFAGGFTPHLSIGQAEGKKAFRALVKKLRAEWEPVPFTVDSVDIIQRGHPPNDAFWIEHHLELKGTS